MVNWWNWLSSRLVHSLRGSGLARNSVNMSEVCPIEWLITFRLNDEYYINEFQQPELFGLWFQCCGNI